MSTDQSRPRADQSRPVPPASPDQSARRPRWNNWRRLAATWWVAREAWHHLATGPLHPLASQWPLAQPRDTSHPGWCSQTYRGRGCGKPSVAGDGTVEWAHARPVEVEHLDGVAEVCTLRMEALRPDGVHDVDEVIVLGVDAAGSFTAAQAEAFGLAILEAVRRLDAGLPGVPGGVPAVLAAAEARDPATGRSRAV
jgi:hypothetical protein